MPLGRNAGHARHAALVGTTASGKSAVAMALARRRPDVEIVSVDSMQVYRGMDIGTDKPSPADRAEVVHHLLDIADPGDEFAVAEYQRAFRDVIADIEARGRRALLVGGTGLYLRAAVDSLAIPGQYPEVREAIEVETDTGALHRQLTELDPLAAGRMEPGNRRRIVRALEVTLGAGRPFSSYGPGLDAYPATSYRLLGIERPAADIAARITNRYERQLAAGFLDEVRGLAERPGGLSRTARQALGYKELLGHLRGESDLDAAIEVAIGRTRRFARRQRVWFRRDPRISWFAATEEPVAVADELLRHW